MANSALLKVGFDDFSLILTSAGVLVALQSDLTTHTVPIGKKMKAATSRLRQLRLEIRRFFAAVRAKARCCRLDNMDQELQRRCGLDDRDQEVLRCKVRAAPTMQQRSRGHWRLPYLYELTLDQAHTSLRQRLEQKLNRPEKELRAKLKSEFNSW